MSTEELESLQEAGTPEARKTPEFKKAPEEKVKPPPLCESVGQRLQWARQEVQNTPEELAWVIRENGAIVTSSDVLAWESDTKEPNPIQWRALDLSLQQAPDWLKTGNREPAPKAARSPFVLAH